MDKNIFDRKLKDSSLDRVECTIYTTGTLK